MVARLWICMTHLEHIRHFIQLFLKYEWRFMKHIDLFMNMYEHMMFFVWRVPSLLSPNIGFIDIYIYIYCNPFGSPASPTRTIYGIGIMIIVVWFCCCSLGSLIQFCIAIPGHSAQNMLNVDQTWSEFRSWVSLGGILRWSRFENQFGLGLPSCCVWPP